MQPAAIDETLGLCTRYQLGLGGLRHCGMRSLPDTFVHMTSTGDQTRDLLILSTMHYPLSHVLSFLIAAIPKRRVL